MIRAFHTDSTKMPSRGFQSHMAECRNCGLLQIQPPAERRDIIFCSRCKTQLEHSAGKSLDATLACSVAIMLLLIPAWTAPFLTASALGTTRTSFLPMSVSVVWRDGSPLLALCMFLFVLTFPLIRFGGLTAVLLTLRLGWRPTWQTQAFRICNALQVWAMLDVFLLGLMVAYFRLRSSLEVTLGAGAICFIIAGLLSLVARATLDKAQVWRLIGPDRRSIRGPSMVCLSCELVMPRADGATTCPRCHAVVTARKRNAYSRSMALLLTAGLMYLPANIYPIATLPTDLRPTCDRFSSLAFDRFGGAGIYREFHHSFAEDVRIGLVRFVGNVRFVSISGGKDSCLSRRGGNRSMVHGGSPDHCLLRARFAV
jgi:paraquat-inducible protein A